MSSPVWKKIAIPFAILLFPVVFWLVLITGKNHFKTLAITMALFKSVSGVIQAIIL